MRRLVRLDGVDGALGGVDAGWWWWYRLNAVINLSTPTCRWPGGFCYWKLTIVDGVSFSLFVNIQERVQRRM